MQYLMRVRAGIICSFVFCILVSWNLLGPGYILALDTVFGPNTPSLGLHKFLSEGSVFGLIEKSASLFMPIWVFEKIFLGSMLFLIFLVPYLVLDAMLRQGKEYSAGRSDSYIHVVSAIAGSTLYACNNFVYQRFIAGQWQLLFGYALLPLLFLLIVDRFHKYAIWQNLLTALLLCAISVFSTHALVVGVCILIIVSAVSEYTWVNFLKKSVTVLFICSVLGSWYMPTVVSYTKTFANNQILSENSFSITGEGFVSKYSNTLLLRGFWLESSSWSNNFVMPNRDLPRSYQTGLLLIVVVIFVGLVYVYVKRSSLFYRRLLHVATLLFSLTGISVLLLPSFIGSSNQSLNMLGVGFRDSSKLSMLIVFVYSILFALGARGVLRKVTRNMHALTAVLIALPLLYAPSSLFGASGALKVIWYPKQWQEAVSMVSGPDCKVLVLPWHQYYSQSYLDYSVTANPAAHIIPCITVVSADSGVNGGKKNGPESKVVSTIDSFIKNPSNDTDFISFLKHEKFTHILYSMDVIGEDLYQYTFLTQLKPLNSYSDPISSSVLLFKI